MIYEQIVQERKKLEEQIKLLQLEIQDLPPGKLTYSKNGRYCKWYQSDGHRQTYIPKNDRLLAEKLAYKNYITLQLKNLCCEKEAIDSYLKHHDKNAILQEESFLNSIPYKELLSNILIPTSHELDEWQKSPYEKNNKYPENLKHKTFSGNLVRSKSEALIDMLLFRYRIPFRYEAELQVGDILLYPDFTIRHPKTGKFYYWEHFGCMDDPVYNRNAMSKLQLYVSNDIIPNIQLITTYETKENPLDGKTVEKIIELYFL